MQMSHRIATSNYHRQFCKFRLGKFDPKFWQDSTYTKQYLMLLGFLLAWSCYLQILFMGNITTPATKKMVPRCHKHRVLHWEALLHLNVQVLRAIEPYLLRFFSWFVGMYQVGMCDNGCNGIASKGGMASHQEINENSYLLCKVY